MARKPASVAEAPRVVFWIWCVLALIARRGTAGTAPESVPAAPFRFEADTFAFANQTVYTYGDGHAETRARARGTEQAPTLTLRCFAMCRSVEQFRKFARFDPALPPPDDAALAASIRQVTGRAVWRQALPDTEKVVIPGYADLRAMSAARPRVVEDHIGGGLSVYLRPGNYRMFFYILHGPRQQAHTRQRVEETLDRNGLFIAYLTTFPSLSINHAVIIYGRGPSTATETAAGISHYLVYDPNHADHSRDMRYDAPHRMFAYQKDWDFVGGRVTVLQVYSHFGQ